MVPGPTLSLTPTAPSLLPANSTGSSSLVLEPRSALSSRDNEEITLRKSMAAEDQGKESDNNHDRTSNLVVSSTVKSNNKPSEASRRAESGKPTTMSIPRPPVSTIHTYSNNQSRPTVSPKSGKNVISSKMRGGPTLVADGPPKQLDTISGSAVVANSSTNTSPEAHRRTAAAPVLLDNSSTVEHHEQILFEKRLCDDADGVAVKKINQNGKTSLRYLRCIPMEDVDTENRKSSWSTRSSSSRSANSHGQQRRNSKSSKQQTQQRETPLSKEKKNRVMVWGKKKKDVQIPLERFVLVRKGKTTVRTRRNTAFKSLVLSLITNDPDRPSLDIEAPTKVDRDKFARAFAKFLEVPLIEENASVAPPTAAPPAAEPKKTNSPSEKSKVSTQSELLSKAPPSVTEAVNGVSSVPDAKSEKRPSLEKKLDDQQPQKDGAFPPRPQQPTPLARDGGSDQKIALGSHTQGSQVSSTGRDPSAGANADNSYGRPVVSIVDGGCGTDDKHELDTARSDVSSITGHGFDIEIVEELHMALNELRSELEESRAEAARAVKVAEQAIQSAERSNSAEWQNTVTHKAAEAAAMAQKRSAEAMAKQRLAEERLDAERRTAAFWKRQAQVVEEEAGSLQTRAAAAEVQKAAMAEQLDAVRRSSAAQLLALKKRLLQEEQHLGVDTFLVDGDVAVENERKLDASMSQAGIKQVAHTSNNFTTQAGNIQTLVSKAKGETESPSDLLQTVQTQASLLRDEFEILKKDTTQELDRLPADSRIWVEQIVNSMKTLHQEAENTRQRLAFEISSRRKLLQEVQDLRGTVRVYCRPMKAKTPDSSILSRPSQETVMLQRARRHGSTMPVSFEFDSVFDTNCSQEEIHAEIGEIFLGVLDGYNICVMAYGPTRCGKTTTLLGKIELPVDPDSGSVTISNPGTQLLAVQQLFSIAVHRTDRFKDVFSLTILEVFNERLTDMIAGTKAGDARGEVIISEKSSGRRKIQKNEDDASSGRQTKLEIRSDLHGETVVQGLISVTVASYQDFLDVWQECLQNRQRRLVEMDVDIAQYDASCHIISTLKVMSSNIATGLGTVGKLQFVDLAGSDLTLRGSSKPSSPAKDGLPMPVGDTVDWKFANRSIETLSEVVSARLDFQRSVPYRNSTITHLLRDNLEHDTKVLVIACVSSDASDLHDGEYAQVCVKYPSRPCRQGNEAHA